MLNIIRNISKNFKKIVILVVIVGLLTPGIFAAYDEDTMTIDVTVDTATSINIIQGSLTWSVNPGTDFTGEKVIEVKNVGSTNVTGMYAYVNTITTEPTNPIGQSDPTKYSAGGVLTLRRNESTSTDHWFAGRLEWNTTSYISLATLLTGFNSSGWFKNTSSDFVWDMRNGSDGTCNTSSGTGSDPALEIEEDDDLGTAATRDPEVSGTYEEGTLDWGLFKFDSDPWNGYCVATFVNCTKLYIYKYDRRATGTTNFDGCTNSRFLNTTMWLGPSEFQRINLDVWMPSGMPAGGLTQAILTVYAATG